MTTGRYEAEPTMRQIFKNMTFGEERALYGVCGALVEDCRIEGEEDGESFLKESKDIAVRRCRFDLRYPFWHTEKLELTDSEMTENCRAALWYGKKIRIERCAMNGIKALRECSDVSLKDVRAVSPEFGWRCERLSLADCSLASEYAFFGSKDIAAERLGFTGKYSFQYTERVSLSDCALKTKDAFWHATDVTVSDSVVDGEYLGWYSEGLTFVRCKIRGTQPFCYCKRLKLIDCTMEDCDLAFEYSDVEADVKGTIASVKNPRSGRIVADGYGEIILRDSKYPAEAQILKRKQEDLRAPNLGGGEERPC